jgi:hypothetical protein
MELHTLGVNSGYTQQDVQQLSLILTGATVLPQRWPQCHRWRHGKLSLPSRVPVCCAMACSYSTARPARFRSTRNSSAGPSKAAASMKSQAVDLIVRATGLCDLSSRKQLASISLPTIRRRRSSTPWRKPSSAPTAISPPCCARCSCRNPSRRATARSSRTPRSFLVSAMRLSYDGKPIGNADPLVNWLRQMSELPLYGHITPDGWALDSPAGPGSGQMASAFDVRPRHRQRPQPAVRRQRIPRCQPARLSANPPCLRDSRFTATDDRPTFLCHQQRTVQGQVIAWSGIRSCCLHLQLPLTSSPDFKLLIIIEVPHESS